MALYFSLLASRASPRIALSTSGHCLNLATRIHLVIQRACLIINHRKLSETHVKAEFGDAATVSLEFDDKPGCVT
jgi:hypothetical protein